MSTNEAGIEVPKKNDTRPVKTGAEAPKKTARVKLRKHRVENINRNQLAQVLDTYSAEGRAVLALNISRDIGGTYEVVTYKDELV